jgi:hypothetical protein
MDYATCRLVVYEVTNFKALAAHIFSCYAVKIGVAGFSEILEPM